MPALENNLLAVFFVLLVLGAFGALGWGLWKPVGRRAWSYLRVWWQQDKIAEAEAKRTAQARKAARRELAEACAENAPTEETTAEAAQKLKAECASSAPNSRQTKAECEPATETPKSLIGRK